MRSAIENISVDQLGDVLSALGENSAPNFSEINSILYGFSVNEDQGGLFMSETETLVPLALPMGTVQTVGGSTVTNSTTSSTQTYVNNNSALTYEEKAKRILSLGDNNYCVRYPFSGQIIDAKTGYFVFGANHPNVSALTLRYDDFDAEDQIIAFLRQATDRNVDAIFAHRTGELINIDAVEVLYNRWMAWVMTTNRGYACFFDRTKSEYVEVNK